MKQVFLFLILSIFGLVSCQSQVNENGYTDLDVKAFKAKIAEPGVVLLDVRTPEETAQGKIEGCTELDFEAVGFEAKLDGLDKNKTYLVYCRSGNRSGQASTLMVEKGFKHVYNLKGGYLAWTGNE